MDPEVNDLGGGGESQAAAIRARLVQFEAKVDGFGWDQPATLWFLSSDGTMYAVPEPVFDPPEAALVAISMLFALRHGLFAGALEATMGIDPVATVFLAESWANDNPRTEEEKATDYRKVADLPGSVEVRSVCAVDLEGGQYLVSRVRGAEPTTRYIAPGRGDMQPDGRVFESLLLISKTLRTAGATA